MAVSDVMLFGIWVSIAWIPSREVQACTTCFVVRENSIKCGLFADNVEFHTPNLTETRP
jgi:hypothetical protein